MNDLAEGYLGAGVTFTIWKIVGLLFIVVAFLMLNSRDSKLLACLGILANLLLLVGDFGTGGFRGPVVASFVGVGYVLLVAWFVLLGRRLLGLPSSTDAQLAGHT